MKIQNGISLKPQDPSERAAKLDGQIKDAAKMYESYFLNEMVKAMRATVKREGGLMAPNMAEKIFSEQLDQKYVDAWSNKGGIGLADLIAKQIHERIKGAQPGPKPQGVLPIAPKNLNTDSLQMKVIKAADDRLSYRFSVPDPSGEAVDVQTPFSGVVRASRALEDGWQLVELDHGPGLSSELTFPGRLAEIAPGQSLLQGQRLGQLDETRPVLAWNLDLKG